MDGYVYLLVEGDCKGNEKYKIGVTKNSPEKRLKNLKTGNSGELSIVKTYKSENYLKIERWLHRKYKNQQTISKNEFFHLEDDEVINFIDECKKIDAIVTDLRKNNHFYN